MDSEDEFNRGLPAFLKEVRLGQTQDAKLIRTWLTLAELRQGQRHCGLGVSKCPKCEHVERIINEYAK